MCTRQPLLFASAFDKRLPDRKYAFKRFNGNNQATSCSNLVNFCPVKTRNFCRYSPAIWRRSTFVMLVFRNGIGGSQFFGAPQKPKIEFLGGLAAKCFVIKSTAAILTKFCTVINTSNDSFVCRPKMHHKSKTHNDKALKILVLNHSKNVL